MANEDMTSGPERDVGQGMRDDDPNMPRERHATQALAPPHEPTCRTSRVVLAIPARFLPKETRRMTPIGMRAAI